MGFGNEKGLRGHHAVSTQTGERPMIEKYPLEKAADAYKKMIAAKARFWVVLTMN
jgi:D-arabinose 1-dehydrogenase-like Zn-dependent alcohol dehydrogenase